MARLGEQRLGLVEVLAVLRHILEYGKIPFGTGPCACVPYPAPPTSMMSS